MWGEPIGSWLREACAGLGVEVVELLTLAETGGAVAARSEQADTGFQGLGDATPEAAEGRLLVRAPWADAAATAAGLGSGDLAEERGDGKVVLRGHSGFAIESDGTSFSPEPLERLLATAPIVRRAFVILRRTGTRGPIRRFR